MTASAVIFVSKFIRNYLSPRGAFGGSIRVELAIISPSLIFIRPGGGGHCFAKNCLVSGPTDPSLDDAMPNFI